jgi:transposase
MGDGQGEQSANTGAAHLATVSSGCSRGPGYCVQLCTLRAGKAGGFAGQKSGIEEVYAAHTSKYGTAHYCKFLPKFHPELNPIERCWSRLKWYIRKYSDGKIEHLRSSMDYGLSTSNMSLALIRRYIRLVTAYNIAYEEGKDIIQAEAWIRKHRTHRGCSAKMDAMLESLYFPLGRAEHQEEETAEQDHQEETAGEQDLSDEQDSSDLDAQLLSESNIAMAQLLLEFHTNG